MDTRVQGQDAMLERAARFTLGLPSVRVRPSTPTPRQRAQMSAGTTSKCQACSNSCILHGHRINSIQSLGRIDFAWPWAAQRRPGKIAANGMAVATVPMVSSRLVAKLPRMLPEIACVISMVNPDVGGTLINFISPIQEPFRLLGTRHP